MPSALSGRRNVVERRLYAPHSVAAAGNDAGGRDDSRADDDDDDDYDALRSERRVRQKAERVA